ncbi:hypothetical protein [Marinomonas balearica]|uniref:DinB family protein n=1 Tax=Marinomonas balearica TaxID=491947 RepID=A0A4R6M4X2_9GAMM|nr:hypothetical protein [Marinomonas balearica]TDO95785.1 hypothetical protein DFP79_3141 [Marinomonas balearica]
MTVISISRTETRDDRAIIDGALEVLQQGLDCLNTLTHAQYVHVASPHMMSSIGAHYRHMLDVFQAVANSVITASTMENRAIDYNLRRRGHTVETSIDVAKAEIHVLMEWLHSLNSVQICQSTTVINELSSSREVSSHSQSTLGREITFSALHANHHYAMIKVALSLINVEVNELFGIAPATATYMRGQS